MSELARVTPSHRTLHILAGTRIRGQLDVLRRRIVQTDDGQVVTVHQLDKHTRDLQTDVKVGEGHVHLQRGESESTLCFPHDEGLVIAARDSSGSWRRSRRIKRE